MTVEAQTWLNLFALRKDDFGIQQPDGSYIRAGQPLTEDIAKAHLNGEITVQNYALRGSECLWGVVDSDSGLLELQRLGFFLLGHGLRPALELSRRGGHLWLLCSEPVEGASMRRVLIGAIKHLGLQLKNGAGGLEVFPGQDQTFHYGSAMRGPLGIHQMTGKQYPLADLMSLTPLEPTTIEGQLAIWQSWPKATAQQIEDVARRFPDHRQPKHPPNLHREALQGLDTLFWAERLTKLQRRGQVYVGLCPFHQETEASFTVWPEDGRYYCFGCNSWGDGYDLKAKAEGRPLADVLREARNG